MSNYSQNVFFASKDSLTPGDPNKIISGAEVDTELAEISTAITSKIDAPGGPSEGDVLTYVSSAWTAAAGSVPSGSLIAYGGTSAPSGWFFCDGAAVSRTTYSDLFSAIGTAYGVGDGSTTFNLPDMRFRVPVGPDNMGTAAGAANRDSAVSGVISSGDADTVGSSGGESAHVMSVFEMPSHTHDFPIRQASGTPGLTGPATIATVPMPNGTTTAAGGSGAHNTMQPFQIANWIIKQ